jgi:hypothetical protein
MKGSQPMNRLTTAALLLAAAAAPACTQDAEIGLTSEPIACQQQAAGDVQGTLTNAAGDHEFQFVTASLLSQPMTARLEDPNGQLTLDLGFQCGSPSLDTYDVVAVSNQQVQCPLEITGYVTGGPVTGDLYADASGGRLVIDENVDCLAGRFDIDFGDAGRLTGWFSLPLQ